MNRRKHKLVLCVCIVGAAWLAFLSASVAATQSASAERVFSGKLGHKYRIQMRLRREGGKLTGTYFYERVQQDLTLRGEIDGQSNFTLREYDAGGAQTGVFKGKWAAPACEECPETLRGNWSKLGEGRALPFELFPSAVAFRSALKIITKAISEKTRKGQPQYEISAEYPQLEGASDARVEHFNQLIRSKALKDVASFRKEFLESADGSEFDLSYDLGVANDDLVSLDFINYFYYGGAGQRNAISETITYDLKQGRQLKFEELFRAGADFTKPLSDYSLRDLKRQYKDDASSTDELLRLHVENVVGDEHKWMITPEGLVLIFDSAEIPPAGGGEARVVVPYSVLKRIIRPDGPLAAFLPTNVR